MAERIAPSVSQPENPRKTELENFVSEIEAWLKRRTFNLGHEDNPTEDRKDYLIMQEIDNKIQAIKYKVPTLGRLVENGFLTMGEKEEFEEEFDRLEKKLLKRRKRVEYIDSIKQFLIGFFRKEGSRT